MTRIVWTQERVAELLGHVEAGLMQEDVGARMGCSADAARCAAAAHGISFRSHGRVPPAKLDAALRRRWRGLIGPMKAALRADLAAAP